MPGLGDNGRVRLHIGKQEHGDDEEAGVSRDIGMFSRRDMVVSQARRLRGCFLHAAVQRFKVPFTLLR